MIGYFEKGRLAKALTIFAEAWRAPYGPMPKVLDRGPFTIVRLNGPNQSDDWRAKFDNEF